jgi:lipopolysaccharide export system permease protein
MKKIDLYILKKFFPLFLGAFFICLFVFMMQFTWRYIDELIGKGLSLDLLAQFFWYMGITLIPMSLPLALLLASLITFGNMGEQLELLSMKAAGVPLIRIMRPVGVVVVLLTGMSFYFQNKTAPEAQISLRTLLISMKQAQPATEIMEGVFNNVTPQLNIYVQKKNAETGMLYQVIIYKTDQGFDRAQIVLADSGRLEMTADKMHLNLELWQGQQSQNFQTGENALLSASGAPYDRETFAYKKFIIDFDSNFALLDKNLLRNMPQAKNMKQIELSVDSVNLQSDSIGKAYYAEAAQRWFFRNHLSRKDSTALAAAKVVAFDSLLARTAPNELAAARQTMQMRLRSLLSDLEWKSEETAGNARFIRTHWIEWHQKMTLSLACIFFFFVGAPLGAIIRKGGLGMPAVVSVLIFIFYYIINTSGMKMARDGSWNMVYGMWISSAVLIPFGVFLTYKANRDSTVFNVELYQSIVRRLFGLRPTRHLVRKEVIIDDPVYDALAPRLDALADSCASYAAKTHLAKAPSYVATFFRHREDHVVEGISDEMESVVEELANTKSARILALTNALPVLLVHAHLSPFARRWTNIAAGIVFPLGLILWFRIWRFRLRLLRDMKLISRTARQLADEARAEQRRLEVVRERGEEE